MTKGVLLDTSFFIRFLNTNEPLYSNAKGYFGYFIEKKIKINMYISTICIAEYYIKGNFDDLPLKDLRILPFNFYHAVQAAEFARIAFDAKKNGNLEIQDRKIIPNDTKLFAQASKENSIHYYLSADKESYKIYQKIKTYFNNKLDFEFLDLHNSYQETFGFLNFD